MREPGADGAERGPLTVERLSELSNASGGTPNPFGAPRFENPFNPDRFLHPLPGKPRSLLRERTVEIERATARLAVIGGHVHRMVDEPVYVQSNGPDGLRGDVRFRDPSSQAGDMTWGVFRADRTDDAQDFARRVAGHSGTPYAGLGAEIRVVYPQILKVDDVQLAFDDAFGRFQRHAKGPVGDARVKDLSDRARSLTADGLGFDDAAQAEEAFDLLQEMRAILGGGPGTDDMIRTATLRVAAYVAERYDALDRDWIAARDAAPTFAP